MKIIRITKDFYVNIDHISEIGLDHRTNGKWFIKILGDDELFYVSEEEAMEIIKEINTVSEVKEQK